MSKKYTFLDNAVSFNDLNDFNDKEKQLLHDIKAKRGGHSGSRFLYEHKDGTRVIIVDCLRGPEAGRTGHDVILMRNDSYIHFETIAEDNYKNAKLNITISHMDNKSKCSYPIGDVYSDSVIEETLVDKNKDLAEIYKSYLPDGLHNTKLGIVLYSEKRQQETENNVAFMSALDKWKNQTR